MKGTLVAAVAACTGTLVGGALATGSQAAAEARHGHAPASVPALSGTILAMTGHPADLVAMRPDGSGRRTLAHGVSDAAYSPRGDRIAFSAGGDVYVMPASGGAARRIVGGPFESRGVTWSPDGRHVAYSSCAQGIARCDLFRVNVDGPPAISRLTSGVERARRCPDHENIDFTEPAWSPRGDVIAAGVMCWSEDDGVLFGAYVDPRGSGIERVFDNRALGAANWSPDGARLAFRDVAGAFHLDAAAIFTMRRDGSALRRMTPLRSNTDTKNNAGNPAISPTGGHLAYARARDATSRVLRDLWITNAAGTSRWRVATNMIPLDWRG